ncbi:ML3 [Symbiodinium sp. CCMP2592]|nr:ML3 [Symbiodinium sp. CCMP2592]
MAADFGDFVSKTISDGYSEGETTLPSERSDDETPQATSCCWASPRPEGGAPAQERRHSVVVRSTFLDLEEEFLQQRYRTLRRTQSDLPWKGAYDPRSYEPGELSSLRLSGLEKLHSQGAKATKPSAPCTAVRSTQPPAAVQAPQPTGKTTVMLRNLPNNYSRDMLLAMLDKRGFAGSYDFVYLPFDFRRDANLGYAFVNMVDAEAADALWKGLEGFTAWALTSHKVCSVTWSGPLQGQSAHIERYRNSPVMHSSVPDQYKPVVLEGGVRKPFPKATKKIKMPTMVSF